MKRNINYKLILLLLVPYLAGEIINRLISLGINLNSSSLTSILGMLLSIWTSLGATVYWFYVGRQFGSLEINKIKGFILGNVLWGISFVLFMWQFVLVDDIHRNFSIGIISQHYALGFISWASRLIRLFTNTIDSTAVVMVAHLIMFMIFTFGFISSSKIKSERRFY